MSTVIAEPIGWDVDVVPTEVFYPESDGQPVGETDYHISVIFYLRAALRYFFRRAPRTYVAGNMLFYFEEGNPSAVKAPDVFVVKGIAKHDRRVYKLWEEGVVPCVVFEITSRSTRLEDLGTKKALYEMLGVKEYFLFDPLDEYLRPRLQGFALIGDYYQPIIPGRDGTLISTELGAILRPEDALLRVIDPKTREIMPTIEEASERAAMQLERANAEAQRAIAETQRANAETQRAIAEAQRANAAEAEAARLRSELEQLRRQMAQP